MTNRRNFIKLAGMGALGLAMPNYLTALSSNYTHKPIEWKKAAEGLDFSKVEIYRDNKLVEVIASIKINPEKNKIRVFNGYTEKATETHFIEDWQRKTGAFAMINGNQFMANPYYYPCDLVISDNKQIGPKQNKYSKGIFLAEPKNLEGKLKKADLLDFDYDSFDYKTTQYTQGVQHWPILLDREGKIKTKNALSQASRTVIAKTKEGDILFITTKGEYFTLYNFGEFLKESNKRTDNGFNVHTAMNLDGGMATSMILKTNRLNYINEAFDKIPCVIGVFPRN